MKPFALEGDVAVVTGAASGIGREIAKTFAREGAAVACFDKNVQGLASVTAEIETAGGRALPVALDLSDSSQVNAAMQQVFETFGKLTILINCAALINYKPVQDTTDEDFHRLIDTNLCG